MRALFDQLLRRRWKVEVLCWMPLFRCRASGLRADGWEAQWLCHRPPVLAAEDRSLGYPCWRIRGRPRGILDFLNRRLEAFRPDVVAGHFRDSIPLLRHAAGRGYPSLYFARIVYDLPRSFRFPSGIRVLANSPFAASAMARMSPHPVEVVFPPVDPRRYRVRQRSPRQIAFLHSPYVDKGIRIAAEIARRMPEERFLFVGVPTSRRRGRREIPALPGNVEILGRQEEIRSVYRQTKILLVPSQCPDAFGRVILEAHVNGIPAVAANVGGLAHTLGRGGILVDPPEEPAAYVEALRRLCSDRRRYAKISVLARANSRRPEFDSRRQVSRFVSLAQALIRRRRRNRPHHR